MGSCVQMLIQLPIIYALYKVIYAIPAYIGQVKAVFSPMVDNLIAQPGSAEFIQGFKNAAMYMKQFSNELFVAGDPIYVKNTFIDVLNKASTPEWNSLAEKFPTLAQDIMDTSEKLASYNSLFGMNIGDSPSYYLSNAMQAKNVLLIIAALAIPVLAAVTQWLNVKLMPQPESNGEQNSMMSSMKMMNNIMPIMSAVFCFSLPAGVGLYWVASAVVRSIQQVLVNKHIDKTDFDQLIEKNKDKAKKKQDKRIKRMEKAGIDPKTINQYASMNTRNVQSTTPKSNSILPSITRRSLMYVAKEYLGLEVEEREVYFDEVKDFTECGLCGTAAVISPVGKINDHGKEICFPSGMDEIGPVLKKLYETLTGIQMGTIEAPEGWIKVIEE